MENKWQKYDSPIFSKTKAWIKKNVQNDYQF